VNRLVSLALVISAIVPAAALRRAPAGQAPRGVSTVRVAAASDLQFAFTEMAARLERRDRSIRVHAAYGSSGTFYAQLRQRAPYDLYLSADVEYPRDLVRAGFGRQSDLFVYAVGRLVLWVPTRSTLSIECDHLTALLSARRIALANPRHAPYGRAAESALRQAGLWATLQPKILLGDNVAQAAQFVMSGGADAALIARSLAVAPAMRGAGRYWDVPPEEHPPLVQGGLVMPWTSSRQAAERVRDYLLSVEGRELLVSYGFGPPGERSDASDRN
jgi:molybdate transport system substrate-binding protein